ncbi:MAG TPA: tetratricopeptide repeat protein [Candidatus Dormibacteraeota bacterium]|nr:tetratricopeptide repeat protein [Candidatus Dormibacteraeota bacterium]
MVDEIDQASSAFAQQNGVNPVLSFGKLPGMSANQQALQPQPSFSFKTMSSSTRTLIICVVLVAMILAAFWPVVHAQFINYDDQDYVTENGAVQQGLTWASLKWAFATTCSSNWHPLTWVSHMLDVSVFGHGPNGPHCVNLGLHAANTVLLFLFLRRVTGTTWRSALVAALFGLHPLHVESVAWVAERKDVLSGFFFMLTLMAYSNYSESRFSGVKSKAQGECVSNPLSFLRGRGDWKSPGFLSYVMAIFFFAMGLMSKPMLVTLPFVLLLLDYWPLGRAKALDAEAFRLAFEKLPFFLLSAASCVVTSSAQKTAMPSTAILPFLERVENALVCYARYLAKAFWPRGLALPYLHPGRWPAEDVALAVVLVLGLCAVAWWARRRLPFLFTGWFWFVGILVPAIGLVQVGIQAMADRYTYLPLIGLFVLVAWVGEVIVTRFRVPWQLTASVSLGILGLCGVLSRAQAGYWRDSETLFKHSAAVTEGNYVALANAAGSLFERGHLEEAMTLYNRALDINPNYPDAVNSIGVILAAKGNPEAIEWFRRALVLDPAHPEALVNMGNALSKREDYVGAARYYQEAVHVRPDNYRARNNLGNALLKLGRIDEAILAYRASLRAKSDDPMIYANLAGTLAARGRFEEAIPNYQMALKFQGTNEWNLHYGLGLALAVKGRWDEAIAQYQETLRLSPLDPEAEYNLGYALQVQKRWKESAIHLNRALELRPEFPLAHYNLGCVLSEQGSKEQAIVQLRQALREKPDYSEAKQKLASLQSGN